MDTTLRKENNRAMWDIADRVPHYVNIESNRMNWRSQYKGSRIYGDVFKRGGARVSNLAHLDDLKAHLAAGDFGAPTRTATNSETIFEVSATEVTDGEPLISRFGANRVESFEATFQIHPSGLIESFSSTVEVVRDNELLKFDQQYRISKVENTTVSKPAWVSTARTKAPELSGSLTDNRTTLVIEHTGGQTVPSETTIQVVEDEENVSDTQSFPGALEQGDRLYAVLSSDGTLSLNIGTPPSVADPISMSRGHVSIELLGFGWFYKAGLRRL
jgi:hypothetical protein